MGSFDQAIYRRTSPLKSQSQSPLYLARGVGCRSNGAGASGIYHCRRHLELRMVEHVEELNAEKQRSAFLDREMLLQGAIKVYLAGATQGVSADITPVVGCRGRCERYAGPASTPWGSKPPTRRVRLATESVKSTLTVSKIASALRAPHFVEVRRDAWYVATHAPMTSTRRHSLLTAECEVAQLRGGPKQPAYPALNVV